MIKEQLRIQPDIKIVRVFTVLICILPIYNVILFSTRIIIIHRVEIFNFKSRQPGSSTILFADLVINKAVTCTKTWISINSKFQAVFHIHDTAIIGVHLPWGFRGCVPHLVVSKICFTIQYIHFLLYE